MASIQQGTSLAPPSHQHHVGHPVHPPGEVDQGGSATCHVEGVSVLGDLERSWHHPLPPLGGVIEAAETNLRSSNVATGDTEGGGKHSQVGARSDDDPEIPLPGQGHRQHRQVAALVMATELTEPTGGMACLATAAHPGETTVSRPISPGSANSAGYHTRIVRVLLNPGSLCYVNALVLCLGWTAVLAGAIDPAFRPMGGFELFRSLTTPTCLPLNLAVFRPFLWLLSLGWTEDDLARQNDVADFGYWMLWRTQPRFINCEWVAQLLRAGHIESQNGTEKGSRFGPILLPLYNLDLPSCCLQSLIDQWHDGLGVCRAAQKVGAVLVISGTMHQQISL